MKRLYKDDEAIKNWWRQNRSAEAAARALNIPLDRVRAVYAEMDRWKERQQGANPFLVAPALLLVMFLAPLLHAQRAPRVELFGGGSGAYTNLAAFYGGQAEAAINVTRYLGFVGDFGLQSHTETGFMLRQTEALGGFQLILRHRISPFVHGLVGTTITKVGPQTVQVLGTNITTPGITNHGLGVAVGGGLDISLNRFMALRLMPDWTPSKGTCPSSSDFLPHACWLKNQERISFGLVFKIGGPSPRKEAKENI